MKRLMVLAAMAATMTGCVATDAIKATADPAVKRVVDNYCGEHPGIRWATRDAFDKMTAPNKVRIECADPTATAPEDAPADFGGK